MLLACYSHKHISYRIRTIIRKAILLERQADPNIQDNNGKAPLDLVQEGLDKNPENKDLEKIKNLLSDTMNELSNQSKDKQDPSSMLTESVVDIAYSRGSSK